MKYSAHLLSNDPTKMEGTHNLKFAGVSRYTSDYTADRMDVI